MSVDSVTAGIQGGGLAGNAKLAVICLEATQILEITKDICVDEEEKTPKNQTGKFHKCK